MITSKHELANFFGSLGHEGVTAEAAIKSLEAAGIFAAGGCRLSTVRGVCDSVAQRTGRRLSDLSSHDMADLLRMVVA
jgi:hypothetical protein